MNNLFKYLRAFLLLAIFVFMMSALKGNQLTDKIAFKIKTGFIKVKDKQTEEVFIWADNRH